jgi:hypothetical protein
VSEEMITIKSFTTVKSLLDDVAQHLSANLVVRNEQVIAAMTSLSNTYDDSVQAQAIDFGDSAVQYAYLYKYMAAHANFVYKALNSCKDKVLPHFVDDHLNIAVIGGGPGSEALGVAMFADDYNRRPILKCLMCSPQAYWQATWNKLTPTLSSKVNVEIAHLAFDLTAVPTPANINAIRGAKLFFFVKVLCEVKNAKPAVDQSLASIITEAQSGSLFVFIDNLDADVFDWFDNVVQQHSLTIEHSEQTSNFRIIDGQQTEELKEHIQEINGWHTPSMRANLAIRVVVKP